MSTTVQSPVAGRAVRLEDVPDPIFAQAMVGPGAAVDPLREVVDALAPISGKLLKMMPHAYIILASDGTGVLVHLGIDTVQLNGEGFTLLASEGDEVVAGQPSPSTTCRRWRRPARTRSSRSSRWRSRPRT